MYVWLWNFKRDGFDFERSMPANKLYFWPKNNKKNFSTSVHLRHISLDFTGCL